MIDKAVNIIETHLLLIKSTIKRHLQLGFEKKSFSKIQTYHMQMS